MSAEVERRYFVEAAAKALDVLESFNGFQEELSISDIVRRVGLNYCSAFRLLYTLEQRGYVSRTARAKRFRLTPPRKRFRVGYARLGHDCPYSEEVSRSMVLAARVHGIDLIVRDNEFSPPKALANVDAFLEERVHLVIEHQWSECAAELIAARCKEAGVPLVSIDFAHPGAYYFGADHHMAGQLSGQVLSQFVRRWEADFDKLLILPPRGMRGNRKAYVAGVREGLKAVLKESPRTEVVTPEGSSTSDGYRAAKQALQGSTNSKPVLIAAATDAFAIGSGRAASKMGAGTEVAVVGLGGGHDGRTHLLRGKTLRASVASFPETYGERVISIAMHILQGEPVPVVSHTQHVVLTTANLEQYYPSAASRQPRTSSVCSGHLEAIECAS